MRWWERSIGGKTRGRIIALLRRKPRTVEELAEDLGVSDNAVRAQLALLEEEGITRSTGTRVGPGPGKPAVLYGVSPSAEPALSAAYAPVLAAVLATLAERVDRKELTDLLRAAGVRLAGTPARGSSFDARVRSAASLLNTLGGEVDVERTPAGYRLRGFACPLSAAVAAEPCTCVAVEELVAAVVGAPVRECCDRSEGARCRFEVTRPTE